MLRNVVRFALCALVVPAALSAQRSIEIGPVVALYAPMGSYAHPGGFFRVGTPDEPSDNRGVAWGGEGRFWLSSRIGIQLQGATSAVDHPDVLTPGGGSIGTSSRVSSATAQAMLGLLPSSSKSRLWVSAGAGAIHHDGTAYTPYGSPTNLAGVVGFGSSIVLPYGIGANIGASSLLYHWEISDLGTLYQRGFETDVLLHAGLTLNLH